MADKYDFKIGMLGPRQVGKTSLVSCVLEEAQRMVAGMAVPITIEPIGGTEARISNHDHDLDSAISQRTLTRSALRASSEPFRYEIEMKVEGEKILWAMLDYPGGWLDPLKRAPEDQAQWDAVREWIYDSSVLLVPIDATLIMEASEPHEVRAAYTELQISSVEKIVRNWAQGRAAKEKPSLLILSPVKCESYFADRGGMRDAAETLYQRVIAQYGRVLDAVTSNYVAKPELARVEYHPVDTLGCVELEECRWERKQNALYEYELSATYRVREKPGVRVPHGGGGILNTICQTLTSERAEANYGFFGNIWAHIWGSRQKLRAVIKALGAQDQWPRKRVLVGAVPSVSAK